MSDYIKREDAKDAVINIVGWKKIAMYVDEMSNHPSTKDIDYYDALIDAEDVIDDLPPADVAPIKHGRWVNCEFVESGFKFVRCSECKHDDMNRRMYKYCPNCGTKMDKEDLDRWRNEQKAKGEY